MTAIKKYARLEASALWRASPDEQRREVVISIGDATLTISDLRDRILTHWSLAAIERDMEMLLPVEMQIRASIRQAAVSLKRAIAASWALRWACCCS